MKTLFYNKNRCGQKGFSSLVWLLIFALICVGLYFYFYKNNFETPPNTNDKAPATTTSEINLKTYTNTSNKFSIKYLDDFTLNESNDGGYLNELNLFDLSLNAPKDLDKNTDFNVGRIEILISSSTSKCYTSSYSNEEMSGILDINGKSFHYDPKQPFDDAASGGQRGKYSLFALIDNNKCYRITKLVGYRDLRGFADPPYPQHFDEAKVNKVLDDIISSFLVE